MVLQHGPAAGTAGAGAPGAERYETLDSLRGIAALAVAAYHFNPAAYSLLGSALGNAYLLVDFFFVLSGFVIAHAYVDRLRTGRDLQDFVARRIGRLYPLHLFALLPYVVLESLRLAAMLADQFDGARPPFTDVRSLDSLLANLLLIQGMGAVDLLSWNGPSWSISAEFWTYLVFAGVVLAAAPRWRLVAAGVIALGALGTLVAMPIEDMNVTTDYGFLRCLAGFFVGMLLHAAQRRGVLGFGGARAGTGAEVAAVLSALLFIAVAGDGRLSLAAPLVFAGVVLVFARGEGAVSSLLRRPALVLLGTLSYAVYMLHAFGVYVVNTAAKLAEAATGLTLTAPFSEDGMVYSVIHLSSPLAMDAATLVFLSVVLVIAAFVHRWVEVPGRALVVRLVGPAAPRLPGRAAAASR